MSKATDQLTPEDFGKSFDAALFSEWKKSVEAHEKISITSFVLYLVGFAAMLVLGGFVGIGLFFAMAIIGLVVVAPKKKTRSNCQRKLGITNKEVREAIAKSRLRQR